MKTNEQRIRAGTIKIQEQFTEIKRLESEITTRRNDIAKIAENCDIKWFRNKWMTNKVVNKLEEIRYWNS